MRRQLPGSQKLVRKTVTLSILGSCLAHYLSVDAAVGEEVIKGWHIGPPVKRNG